MSPIKCHGEKETDIQFAPVEAYNYHPLLPPSDPESPSKEEEKVCSICMEQVDTQPGPSSEVLLGINPRRGYALAPCHHLFHTNCLSQWLAIKVRSILQLGFQFW